MHICIFGVRSFLHIRNFCHSRTVILGLFRKAPDLPARTDAHIPLVSPAELGVSKVYEENFLAAVILCMQHQIVQFAIVVRHVVCRDGGGRSLDPFSQTAKLDGVDWTLRLLIFVSVQVAAVEVLQCKRVSVFEVVDLDFSVELWDEVALEGG